METIWKQQRSKGSGLINVEHNYALGGKLYGFYIVLRFILDMWDGSDDKPGEIRIRCNNLTEILDSS